MHPQNIGRTLALLALCCWLAGCNSLGGVGDRTPRVSTFETDPTGASVFVDGGFVGTTPASFHLPAKDRVEVRIEAPGYMPHEDVLLRRSTVPEDAKAEEGVGWEELYYFQLLSKS